MLSTDMNSREVQYRSRFDQENVWTERAQRREICRHRCVDPGARGVGSGDPRVHYREASMVLRNLSVHARHSSSGSRDLMPGLRESRAELRESCVTSRESTIHSRHLSLTPRNQLVHSGKLRADAGDQRLGFQHLCVHIRDSTLGLRDERATLRDLCLTPGGVEPISTDGVRDAGVIMTNQTGWVT